MKATLTSESFNQLITCVKEFVEKNEFTGRTNDVYIKLEFKNNIATAIAGDSYKCAVERVSCESCDEFTAYIKPNIKKIPKYQIVEIILKDKTLYISYQDEIVGYKQPLCPNFPDYEGMYESACGQKADYKIAFFAKQIMPVIKSIKTSNESKPMIFKFRSPTDVAVIETKSGYRLVCPAKQSSKEE